MEHGVRMLGQWSVVSAGYHKYLQGLHCYRALSLRLACWPSLCLSWMLDVSASSVAAAGKASRGRGKESKPSPQAADYYEFACAFSSPEAPSFASATKGAWAEDRERISSATSASSSAHTCALATAAKPTSKAASGLGAQERWRNAHPIKPKNKTSNKTKKKGAGAETAETAAKAAKAAKAARVAVSFPAAEAEADARSQDRDQDCEWEGASIAISQWPPCPAIILAGHPWLWRELRGSGLVSS